MKSWSVHLNFFQLCLYCPHGAQMEHFFNINPGCPVLVITNHIIYIYIYIFLSNITYSSVDPVREPNLVITVSADALTPYGVRPSAGTVMTVQSHTCSVFVFKVSSIIKDIGHVFTYQTFLKMADEIQWNLATLLVILHLNSFVFFSDNNITHLIYAFVYFHK